MLHIIKEEAEKRGVLITRRQYCTSFRSSFKESTRRLICTIRKDCSFLSFASLSVFCFFSFVSQRDKSFWEKSHLTSSLYKARLLVVNTRSHAQTQNAHVRSEKRRFLVLLLCLLFESFFILYRVIRERKVIASEIRKSTPHFFVTSRCKCYKSTHAVKRGEKPKCKTYPRRKQFLTSFERR